MKDKSVSELIHKLNEQQKKVNLWLLTLTCQMARGQEAAGMRGRTKRRGSGVSRAWGQKRLALIFNQKIINSQRNDLKINKR